MSDIFLSYDSRDLERIKPLAAALSAQGWTVFYDRTIPPGKTWRQFIGKEIDACHCMIVAWSNYSISSNWVLEEADDGLKRKILVPCLLDDVRPPLGMRAIQATNLVGWHGDLKVPGFKALCSAISELIGAGKDQKVSVQYSGKPAIEHVPNLVEVQPPKAKFDKNAALKEHAGSNEGNVADIFLSYAREDVGKAQLLAEALEKQGWSVFWDRTSIQIGQDVDEVIEEAIEQARCMIVGWSQVSKKSDWVRGEATIGRERRILLPVLFEAVSPPIAFRSLHTEDFSNWQGESDKAEFLNLCKAVARLAGKGQQPDPEPVSAPISSTMPFADITPRPKNARLPFEPEMIEIPAGTFQMGGNRYKSEQPIHTVTFAKPFKLGKYPVTFAEYDAYAEQTGCEKPDDEDWGRDQRPVIHVSWQDAVDYASWLSEMTGKAYRLPSEAEWEYACRAGSTTEFFWGNNISEAEEFAWFDDISHTEGTRPVCQLKPNPNGLYDITGNVWEWVQDDWHDNYQGAPNDGSAWKTGDTLRRVLRGGSIYRTPFRLRSADRFMHNVDYHDKITGFRLAQD